MNLVTIIRIAVRHIKLLIIVPLLLGGLVTVLTRSSPQTYSSKAVVYTGIASGYSIESMEQTRVDLFGTNNAFDNLIGTIKSRKTQEEVSLRLISQHLLLGENNPKIISKQNYQKLKQIMPNEVFELVKGLDNESAFKVIENYYYKNDSNVIYGMVNYTHPHYSLGALSKIQVKRISNSDLIEMTFDTDDPGVCLQTLNLYIEVFIRNYKQLKEIQTDNIAKYFEEQLKLAQGRLDKAEDNLLGFNQSNKIINYYEQTRYIAEKNELMEQDYYKEKMSLVSSQASMEKAEQQLSDKAKIFLKSDNILQIRDSLAQIYAKITEFEIFNSGSEIELKVLNKERENARKLEENLKNKVNDLYNVRTTVEGISIREILTSWLNSAIEYEAGKAKVKVFDERIFEFQKKYDKFAPLGATMKRIEREINVSEQQYLSILYGLNLAKLKQQNIELSSTTKLIDEPFFPATPQPSKRKFLIIIAILIGFIIPFSFLILLEYFDSTIKNLENYKKFTQIDALGIYPFIPKKFNNIDYKKIIDFSSSILLQKLFSITDLNKTFTIAFISTRKEEGKSFIINALKYKLETISKTVEILGDNSQESNTISNPNFRFIEIPALLNSIIDFNELETADLIVHVPVAKRKWEVADSHALDLIIKKYNHKITAILNGVEISELENFIGDVPKKRSIIRVWAKKLLLGKLFEKRFK